MLIGIYILSLLSIVAIGTYIVHHYNQKKRRYTSEDIYNLYEDYKNKGLDVEYNFPKKDIGCICSMMEDKSFKKNKIYKLNFYQKILSKDYFKLELCDKYKQPLSEDDFVLYFYNTEFCFIVLKKNFNGNVYFYDKTLMI
jgi:hypothetical protein